MKSINLDTWKNRPLSWFVKGLSIKTKHTIKDFSNCLGISVGYMNNKLARNSFSVEDMLLILDYCGYEIEIKEKKKC